MHNSRKRILITGMAGFIGFHLAKALEQRHDFVIGCDNFNSYYDPKLKRQRASLLQSSIVECELSHQEKLEELVQEHKITHLVHLAAQAGVRYSFLNPAAYQESNGNGFFHVLEVLRKNPHIKFTFASSSSVYGLNKKIPFSEDDPIDHPANFYAATKKCGEAMAFSYHHLYGIATTGLRFFTVYGPFGRPDMAYYSFTDAILKGKTIRLCNEGNMQRDFTYIDDIIEGCIAAIDKESDFELFNLGNNKPEELKKLINIIEDSLGKKAILELIPMQPGEIQTTYADIEKAKTILGFSPKNSLEAGMKKFLSWHQKSCADILSSC